MPSSAHNSAAAKPRAGTKQPPAAAAQVFWQSAQQLADAAERVANAPRDALVEGGLQSRAQDVGLSGLTAELDHLSERIDAIRGRLATGAGPLLPPAERDKAGQAMQRLVDEGQLISPAALAEGLKFSRQALSKALKAHRMFYVDVQGRRHFPAFFLDPRCERRQLEDVCRALGELPGASKLQFFLTRKASLQGVTPLEALANGQFARVRTAAQGFAER
jgi:hypothetical protein